MSSVDAPQGAFRHPIIDCRLDLLDRLLAGSISRSSRLELVRDVERQIHERLAGLHAADPTDQQVLDAVAAVAAPEAVLAAAVAAEAGKTAFPYAGELGGTLDAFAPPRRKPYIRSARLACGLGIASLLLLLAAPYGYLVVILAAEYAGEMAAYIGLGVLLAVLILVSLSAAGTGLLSLWGLRRHGGAYRGYGLATFGLAAGCLPASIAGVITLLVASSLYSSNVTSTSAPPSTATTYNGTISSEAASQASPPLSLQAAPGSPVATDAAGVVGPLPATAIQLASYEAPQSSSNDEWVPPQPAPESSLQTGAEDPPAQGASGDQCEGQTVGGTLPIVVDPMVAVPLPTFAAEVDRAP